MSNASNFEQFALVLAYGLGILGGSIIVWGAIRAYQMVSPPTQVILILVYGAVMLLLASLTHDYSPNGDY